MESIPWMIHIAFGILLTTCAGNVLRGFQGENITLECSITIKSDDINWYFQSLSNILVSKRHSDGKTSYPSPRKKRITIVEDTSLQIRNISGPEDAGLYICKVGFHEGVVHLKVLERRTTAARGTTSATEETKPTSIPNHTSTVYSPRGYETTLPVQNETASTDNRTTVTEENATGVTKVQSRTSADTFDRRYIAVWAGGCSLFIFIITCVATAVICYKLRKRGHNPKTHNKIKGGLGFLDFVTELEAEDYAYCQAKSLDGRAAAPMPTIPELSSPTLIYSEVGGMKRDLRESQGYEAHDIVWRGF